MSVECTLKDEELQIPTAASLLKIATVTEDDWAREVMKGIREHIIIRIKEEARQGKCSYCFTTKEFPSFAQITVLTNLIEMAHQFEDKGFKISISLWSRCGRSGYHFNVSWTDDDEVPATTWVPENIKYITKNTEAVIS